MFLRQPSAVKGEINAQRIGLTLSDTAAWYADENWITKIQPYLVWNNDVPKRLDSLTYSWESKLLAGVLDASKWSELTYLNFRFNNKITHLVTSNNLKLTCMCFTSDSLSNLDLSACPNLLYLFFDCNSLLNVDLSACPNLLKLGASGHSLLSLDLSVCPNLLDLTVRGKSLLSLDISVCPNLRRFGSTDGVLSHLHIGNLPNLINLDVIGNKLSNLDLSGCPNLDTLICGFNPLYNLDLSPCPNLRHLHCWDNRLSTLDLSVCPKLENVQCLYNLLPALDISGNPNLRTLSCDNNQITTLDPSNCPNLLFLSTNHNPLPTLDLSNCPNLEQLYCFDNLLPDLDVSNCPNLRYLSCSNNQISNLDLSNCPNLRYLSCDSNQIRNLILSDSSNMGNGYIYCADNRLPLSDLFVASGKVKKPESKCFGTQNLLPQRVLAGDSLFSDQAAFVINANTIYTNYAVTQNGSPAPSSSYAVNKGVLIFNDTGVYTITMTNYAIISYYMYPAQVIVELTVLQAYNTDASLSNIGVSAGTLSPAFSSTVFHYTINVPYSIDTITLTATPTDPYATLSGDIGLQQLDVGVNDFTITVTAENKIATATYMITVIRADSTESITEIKDENALRLYPNPATNQLRITNYELRDDMGYSIYSVVGQKVLQGKPQDETSIINVASLAKGLYYLRVGEKTVKFVKE